MSKNKREILSKKKSLVAVKIPCCIPIYASKKGGKKLSKHEAAAAFINLLSSLCSGELGCGGRRNKC